MIVIDTEFSGLDAEKDSLLSVGAIELEHPDNQFYGECRVWEGAHLDPEALKVNGFSKEAATDPAKQSEAELIRAFITWAGAIESRTLVAHNPMSDYHFLRAAAHRAHLDWPFAHRTLDTHTMVAMHMMQRGEEVPVTHNHLAVSLVKAAEYVGIPPETHPHNAMNGTKVCAEVTSRVLLGKPLLPEYAGYPIPWKASEKGGA